MKIISGTYPDEIGAKRYIVYLKILFFFIIIVYGEIKTIFLGTDIIEFF